MLHSNKMTTEHYYVLIPMPVCDSCFAQNVRSSQGWVDLTSKLRDEIFKKEERSWPRRRMASSAGRCIKYKREEDINLMSKALDIKECFAENHQEIPTQFSDEMWNFNEFVNSFLLQKYPQFRLNFKTNAGNVNLISIFYMYLSMIQVLKSQDQLSFKINAEQSAALDWQKKYETLQSSLEPPNPMVSSSSMSDKWLEVIRTDDFTKAIDMFYRRWKEKFASEEAMEKEKKLFTDIIKDYAKTLSTKQILYELKDEEDQIMFHDIATKRLNKELSGNFFSKSDGSYWFYSMIDELNSQSQEMRKTDKL